MTTAFAISPTMGVDIQAVSSLASGSLTTYSPEFGLGNKVTMSDAGEAVYIKAGAAITAGDVLIVNQSTGSAQGITTTLVSANATAATQSYLVAVAHSTLASGQHGWACVKGAPFAGINIGASCNKGTPLYTTATAGQLNTSQTSTVLIAGIEATVTTTTAAVVAGFCNNPVIVSGTVNNL